MSKKHFIALAKALARNKPTEDQTMLLQAEIRQWKRDVESVADVCSAMNPNFDYHTFRAACGL